MAENADEIGPSADFDDRTKLVSPQECSQIGSASARDAALVDRSCNTSAPRRRNIAHRTNGTERPSGQDSALRSGLSDHCLEQ